MGSMLGHEPILSPPHPHTGHLLPPPLVSGLPPSAHSAVPSSHPFLTPDPVLGGRGSQRESRTQRSDWSYDSYLAEIGLESVRAREGLVVNVGGKGPQDGAELIREGGGMWWGVSGTGLRSVSLEAGDGPVG